MFKSEAQRRWLEKNKPDVHKEFSDKTPPMKMLPEHVKSKKDKDKKSYRKGR